MTQTHFPAMLKILNKNLRRFCSRLRWSIRTQPKSKVVIRKFGKTSPKSENGVRNEYFAPGSAAVHPKAQLDPVKSEKKIRIATFNAALFSMAPAVPFSEEKSQSSGNENGDINLRATKSSVGRPKSILKQSPLHPNSINGSENLNLSKQQKFAKSKLRVSINLPDNEISLLRNRQLSFSEHEKNNDPSSSSSTITRIRRGRSFSEKMEENGGKLEKFRCGRTVVEVLRELDADILALQDVKAEEEKEMRPLSALAGALGMHYVFAESWAPEYGNAVLSKWPIKRWKVQKIFDDTDFRNVLKVTIDVPQVGEVNFHCTHLDHLDENWRMKQINTIIQSSNEPHILVGGLNSLDQTDYSQERWTDIVRYYEEMGKPRPKVEVMKLLKSRQYTDAKEFAGECESVVMIAKGQSVQGTCKYGTRVDYILASPNSPYKFVPGSYSVFSSKGTSDHHIVKVDITKPFNNNNNNNADRQNVSRRQRLLKHGVINFTTSSPPQ